MKASSLLFRRRLAASDGPVPVMLSPGAGPHDFNRLILPHLDGAYNLARYLTRDPVLSEDLVQDAMLRAFRAFGQFRGGSARAWLFTIVRNCCRSALAGAAGRVSLVVHESSLGEEDTAQLNAQPDPGPTPEEQAVLNSEIERLRSAIEAIPEPFREVVVLRDLEDLSYAEIAEVTCVPVGTVMSRLSRGRSMLARELLPAGKVAGADQARSTK